MKKLGMTKKCYCLHKIRTGRNQNNQGSSGLCQISVGELPVSGRPRRSPSPPHTG
ncbi:hypothetical protein L195_g040935 [Trifolium pratense]|uniref:Uncharacterized protein n=1 Tax=Trifolium pratense TaxID=57577 RepID=A0A2K3M255_TRIPR|nr:hypothetical protein L195_g040935 [Trifolium pratense]